MDPKNALWPAGQCQFNELVSVCYGRLGKPSGHLVSVSRQRSPQHQLQNTNGGMLHPQCLTMCQRHQFFFFLSQTFTFKSFDTFFYGFFLTFLTDTGDAPLRCSLQNRDKSAVRHDSDATLESVQADVDKLVGAVRGGPDAQVSENGGRNERRLVTAHISYTAEQEEAELEKKKKKKKEAMRNASPHAGTSTCAAPSSTTQRSRESATPAQNGIRRNPAACRSLEGQIFSPFGGTDTMSWHGA